MPLGISYLDYEILKQLNRKNCKQIVHISCML